MWISFVLMSTHEKWGKEKEWMRSRDPLNKCVCVCVEKNWCENCLISPMRAYAIEKSQYNSSFLLFFRSICLAFIIGCYQFGIDHFVVRRSNEIVWFDICMVMQQSLVRSYIIVCFILNFLYFIWVFLRFSDYAHSQLICRNRRHQRLHQPALAVIKFNAIWMVGTFRVLPTLTEPHLLRLLFILHLSSNW